MELCDPNSTPLLPCTPRSDANAPRGNYPGGGAAFMELQFYPPGFAPFARLDQLRQHALVLGADHRQPRVHVVGPCNNDCVEPVNFAFIQPDGVPPGRPARSSPTTRRSRRTAHAADEPGRQDHDAHVGREDSGGHALEKTEETRLTTGRSGFMIASAANGFMNTKPSPAAGPRSTSSRSTTRRGREHRPVGLRALLINTQFEIGHFEPCTRVTGRRTLQSGSVPRPLLQPVPRSLRGRCAGRQP